jgi:hypothetical protein
MEKLIEIATALTMRGIVRFSLLFISLIAPSCMIIYQHEPALFISLDVTKLLILATGFSIPFFLLTLYTVVAFQNHKHSKIYLTSEDRLNNKGIEITGDVLVSSAAFFVAVIFYAVILLSNTNNSNNWFARNPTYALISGYFVMLLTFFLMDFHTQRKKKKTDLVALDCGFYCPTGLPDAACLALKRVFFEVFSNGGTPQAFARRCVEGAPECGELAGGRAAYQRVFNLNARLVRMRQKWHTAQADKDVAPYLMYDAVLDARTEPYSAAFDGLVLPVDSPFWLTHYPPNSPDCRDTVRQISAATLLREGLTVGAVDPNLLGLIDPAWAFNCALHPNNSV